jgi:hypothetical protein
MRRMSPRRTLTGWNRQFADAHGAVDAFIDEIDKAIRQIQRHRHLGIGVEEFRHVRRDVDAAEAGRRREFQMPAGLDAAEADRRLGVGQVVEQALTILQEGLAFEGKRQLACGAHQQAYAQARLQRIEATADDRRRHALGARRRREAAARGGFDESADLLELVHLLLPVKDHLPQS